MATSEVIPSSSVSCLPPFSSPLSPQYRPAVGDLPAASAYTEYDRAAEFDRWLVAHEATVKAEALREAAEQTDWEWETFLAADGVRSIRQHGKTPSDLLRARAAAIEAGETR